MTGGSVGPIHVTVFARTDLGRRRTENQDAFLVVDLNRVSGPDRVRLVVDGDATSAEASVFELGGSGSLLVLADGMGGAAGGRVASRMAIESVYEGFASRWLSVTNGTAGQFASFLSEAVGDANRHIHESGSRQPDLHGMGTTATVAGLLGGVLYLAQVGDSRAYLIRGGEAVQLTRDQSVVQHLVEAGELTREEAETSSRRNVLLQALGTGPDVEVDLTSQDLRKGDTLLLCSDGLSGLVRGEELALEVGRRRDLVALSGALIALANDRGGPDNITVVVARVDGPGLYRPMVGDRVGRQVYVPDEACPEPPAMPPGR